MSESSNYQPRETDSRHRTRSLDELFESPGQSHNERWREIQPEEADLIRRAVVRAQELRSSTGDPGDAYLEGVAITLAAQRAHSGDERNSDAAITIQAETDKRQLSNRVLLTLIANGADGDVSTT